jgi:hypothetical protein
MGVLRTWVSYSALKPHKGAQAAFVGSLGLELVSSAFLFLLGCARIAKCRD